MSAFVAMHTNIQIAGGVLVTLVTFVIHLNLYCSALIKRRPDSCERYNGEVYLPRNGKGWVALWVSGIVSGLIIVVALSVWGLGVFKYLPSVMDTRWDEQSRTITTFILGEPVEFLYRSDFATLLLVLVFPFIVGWLATRVIRLSWKALRGQSVDHYPHGPDQPMLTSRRG